MKLIKNLLKGILILFALLIATLYLTDTDYLLKAVRTIYMQGYTTAFLDDYHKFDNRVVKNGTPQPWPNHADYNRAKETERLNKANKDWG
ncbi:MAG: serine hydrolase, partial [Bizionia paragorgiae]|nr:serine hydrolase [Bizionia paragorgiae]